LRKLNTLLSNNPDITKFVSVEMAQITAHIGGKYVDLFAIPLTSDFKKFIGSDVDKITISADTAESFGLKVGSEIDIVTSTGEYTDKDPSNLEKMS